MANSFNVLLVTTGGTIGGEVHLRNKEMLKHASSLESLLGPTIQHLEDKIGTPVSLAEHALEPVDSSNITMSHWAEIATVLHDRYDEFDAFVVAHGTNTLGYTCAALSFALANPAKPIILTGSQVPAGYPGTDALANLENALRVAGFRQGQDRRRHRSDPVQGVVAVFGSQIITGTRVKKETEFDYDAFKTFGAMSLGHIGRIIHMNETSLRTHNDYLETERYQPAFAQQDLIFEPNFQSNIASITEFPGMTSEIFDVLANRLEVKGIILRAFGAGDPCENHLPAFRTLKSSLIPIVVTTQAPNGNANFQVNEPGARLKEEGLAIPAYDMSIEATTAKLSWLLAKYPKKDDYERVCSEMIRDMRGEVNVLWEIG